ncbi:MAG: FTR1 family protein [Rhodocyclaceae bacterium]
MGNAFFVVWRESLEAFLIAGILFAWLQANDDSGRGRRALCMGLGAGAALAFALGWALVGVQDELAGNALEAFQVGMLVVAAALIAQMVLWMRRHGRHIKTRLHADLSSAAERSSFLGVTIVATLAVAREGAETVIFLYGLSQEGRIADLVIGAASGIVAAAATAWLATRGLHRLNIAVLLRISSILLLIVASALLITAADRMIGAGWLPGLVDPLWDSSALINDVSGPGKLFADFAGYRARPALTVLLVWIAYWAAVIVGWRKTGHA